jgi:Transglutaminase-like superfamily
MLLHAEILWQLLRFQSCLLRGQFAKLHERVRSYPCSPVVAYREIAQQICAAVDVSCLFWLRSVSCLHRSAATVCVLRHHGVPVPITIGIQQWPFKAHAWVELDNLVINDKSYMPEMYLVLDRC